MDKISQGYEQLIQNFVRWAQGQEDIRLALVLGSRARRDHPADAWSDLDILMVARDIHPYIYGAEWINHVGKHWLTFIEESGDGRTMERRALFDGGLDVDFAMLPVEFLQGLAKNGPDAGIADIFHRGVRLLLDKDNVLPDTPTSTSGSSTTTSTSGSSIALLAAAWQPPQPPSEAEFLNAANDFWYHTLWTAKHVRRGELWWGKSCCDGYLKNLLRQMLEWQARAARGAEHDTWLRGRFLEEWADPEAVQQLSAAFAHYDKADIWRALAVTMDIFRRVSLDAAQRLGYAYPTAGAEYAAGLVDRLSKGEDL
jgi:aminoglycoside 6-adenylyltransferase